MIHWRPISCSLCLMVFVGLWPAFVGAEGDVGINPPAGPAPVGGAVLSFHRQLSVPRLTIPGQLTITEAVKNIGSLPATNVTLTQELPPGWTVNGKSSLKVALGDIGVHETVHHTTIIDVSTSSTTGRFPNEAVVSADGVDAVQAQALIDVNRPAVLGASTLAETGQSPALLWWLGFSVIVIGVFLTRREVV